MTTHDSHSLLERNLIRFLGECCYNIQENSDEAVILEGTAVFLERLAQASLKSFTPTLQSALNSLDHLQPTTLTTHFDSLASQLKWRPSPRTDYEGKVMALCTLNEVLDLGDLVAGLLFMTPEQAYPEHQHPPQECYFILSGKSQWMYGGSDYYVAKQTGEAVYNHPQDLHGIKTQQESLLALYFLWGERAANYSF